MLNRICCIPACFILFVFIVSSSVAYHGSDTQRILNAIDHRKFDRTGEIQPNIVVHSYGDKTEIGETSATSDKYQRLFDHDGNLAAVVENGVITHEKYNKKFGMHADAPLNGMSITKSAAASIIGTLLCDGKIDSLSDNAGKYSDFLNKTPYSNITIENILRMASGVTSESGDGQGKFIPMAYGFGKWKGKGSIRKAMNLLKKPHVEQGKRFHYHQADATALSILSHEITGESLRKTFYERVYKNYTDAGRLHWHADSEGYSQTFSGLVMRPQDWAFFGDFILREIKAKSCLGNFFIDGMASPISTEYPDQSSKKYGFMSYVHDLENSKIISFRGHGGQLVAIHPRSQRVIFVASVDKMYKFGGLFENMNSLFD